MNELATTRERLAGYHPLKAVSEAKYDLATEFTHCATRNVRNFAYFAPKISNRDVTLGNTAAFRRRQTVAECMVDALDCKDGPEVAELMQLLADAARGEDIRPQSLNLVKRMAATWAAMNS